MKNTIEETPRKLPLGLGPFFVGFRSQSLNHKNQIRRKIPHNLLPQP
jgi:hypothetical protein